MCVSVCVCACCVYVCVCVCACIYKSVHVLWIYVCVCVCVCPHVCIVFVCLCVCVLVCMFMLCVCVCVCACCLCVCVCVWPHTLEQREPDYVIKSGSNTYFCTAILCVNILFLIFCHITLYHIIHIVLLCVIMWHFSRYCCGNCWYCHYIVVQHDIASCLCVCVCVR